MPQRVVVCSLGGNEDPWLLPASVPSTRPWIHGGERTLYEFATAAAQSGFEVELRGEIQLEALRGMTEATGVKVAAGDLAPRRPDAGEIVVVPEGWTDPMQYLRTAFSPARAMLLACGPPGLVGWDFTAQWAPPDLATVEPDQVARADTFAAMRSLGFELLTNVRGLAELSVASGTPCAFIGSGRPTPWPETPDGRREFDLAVVGDNRWSETAIAAARSLTASSVHVIPECSHERLLRELARARVLVWTGRIEGNARPLSESRAMGTVPVAVRNPVMRDLDEERGAVVVDRLGDVGPEAERLLADPDWLGTLSERAIRSAREQTAWTPFVDRVAAALAAPQPGPGGDARAAAGRALDAMLGGVDLPAMPSGEEADAHLARAYQALRRRSVMGRDAIADRYHETRLALEEADRARAAAEDGIELRDRQIAQLKGTRTFRWTAPLRAPYEWMRRRFDMNER